MSFAGCLIKSGAFKYILELHRKGILHCRSVKQFARLENDVLRGDRLESVTNLHFIGQGEISFKNVEAPDYEFKRFGSSNDILITSEPAETMGNLYCLTGINLKHYPINHKVKVDHRVKSFGDCFLLIHDPNAFLKRVKAAVLKLGLELKHGAVNYKDFSNYTGKKSIFEKHIDFDYQSEYRLHFNHKTEEPINIEIGDLTDISSFAPIELLNELEVWAIKKEEKFLEFKTNLVRKELQDENAVKAFMKMP